MAMAAVGVLLAVVLSGLNMLGSAGVGFTWKLKAFRVHN